MRLSLDVDDDVARELERVAGGDAAEAVLARALTRYLDERGQLAHRREVMEAILTGRPVGGAQSPASSPSNAGVPGATQGRPATAPNALSAETSASNLRPSATPASTASKDPSLSCRSKTSRPISISVRVGASSGSDAR